MSVTASLFAFVITVIFLFILRPVAEAVGLVDVPGGRKKHGDAVPLVGGLAMCLGFAFGAVFAALPTLRYASVLAVFLLVIVGTIDDRFDVPATVRLVAQTCAAMLVVLGSGIVVQDIGDFSFFGGSLGVFAAPFSILFIVTIINAFNVVDGIDGLAGGVGLVSLVSLAIIGVGSDSLPVVLILIGALSGFLLFNLPLGFNAPLRSFMGDAGSTFLGLVIATTGIYLSQGGTTIMSPVTGLWIVAVPVFDLFSAAIRRVMEGKSPFSPDHEHLHHALMVAGLSARGTLALILVCASICAFTGIVGVVLAIPDGVMLLGWFGALMLYYQMMRSPHRVVNAIRRTQALRQVKSA